MGDEAVMEAIKGLEAHEPADPDLTSNPHGHLFVAMSHAVRASGQLAGLQHRLELIASILDQDRELPREEAVSLAKDLLAKGVEYADAGQYQFAEIALKLALHLYSVLDQIERAAMCKLTLGGVFIDTARYDVAEDMIVAAREDFTQLGLDDWIAGANGNLGILFSENGRLREAEQAYLGARHKYLKLNLAQDVADTDSNLAILYRELGRYRDAEMSVLAARNAYSQLNLERDVADSDNSLGNIYGDAGRYREAHIAHIAAQRVYARLGLDRRVADCDANIGVNYRVTGNYDIAESKILAARDVYVRLGLERDVADCDSTLGNIYRNLGRYREAEDAQLSARRVYVELNLARSVADSDQNLGIVYAETGRYPEAEAADLAARDVYMRWGLWVECARIDQNLAELRQVMASMVSGNSQKALLSEALNSAIPALLIMDLVRFTLPGGMRRAAWAVEIGDMFRLVFELSAQIGDPRQVAELIEAWVVSGLPAVVGPSSNTFEANLAYPGGRSTGTEDLLSFIASNGIEDPACEPLAVAAFGGGVLLTEGTELRLELPPRLLWSPSEVETTLGSHSYILGKDIAELPGRYGSSLSPARSSTREPAPTW